MPAQVNAVVQAHRERVTGGIELRGRVPDRSGRAGVCGGVQGVDLGLVLWLPKDLRAAIDLAYQFGGELSSGIAVEAMIVDVPAHVRTSVHEKSPPCAHFS
jgi:hypothetical protein